MSRKAAYQQPMASPDMPKRSPSKSSKNSYPTECTTRYPQQFYCTNCKKAHVSVIDTKWGPGACIWCVCCSGSVIIALLPCCIDRFRDVHHYCPSCEDHVGQHKFCFGS